MGTWGFGVLQDDVVADVLAELERLLKRGMTVEGATASLLKTFVDRLRDKDEGPLVWLGVAHAQWTYGALDQRVLSRVRRNIEASCSGQRPVQGRNTSSRSREAALRRFLARIETPNPHPKGRPRPVLRAPRFRAGDCLAVRLSTGEYGAALVLAADGTDPEQGRNLVAVLDYLGPVPPTPEVFHRREYLRLTHHHWKGAFEIAWYLPPGFRAAASRFSVIASTEIGPSEPADSNVYAGWGFLCEQVILQRQWERSTMAT